MNRHQLQTAEWHEARDIPCGDTPGLRDVEQCVARLVESCKRLVDAAEAKDLAGAAAGLADSILTTYSVALTWGLDVEPFLQDEIHAAIESRAINTTPLLREQIANPVGTYNSIIGRSASAALGG